MLGYYILGFWVGLCAGGGWTFENVLYSTITSILLYIILVAVEKIIGKIYA